MRPLPKHLPLPWTLAPLLLLTSLVVATHHVCTWKDAGPDSPATYWYEHYCTATPQVSNDSHARYYCPKNQGNGDFVADYGYLKAETINFASPCSFNGYFKFRHDCHWPYIGVCIGEAGPTVDESKISCLYMSSKDDCEWPDRFPAGTYPAKVDIWRKSF
ncbi:hypothetical protein BDZ90DRAFT_230620 [Jaminaea rosea]|uniref:Uncharacterized protein n=1 Tax=Jaminaea rosea TaxID=1569628 RepID=A0A316UXQ6_9BASI|nr:hypothetical protein BDZ90DRAFT_230620 [Jaminaea rosea]PWN29774.1 hypothetical protein BDZ90DRAFT_230620 [Jaminaea rosea]